MACCDGVRRQAPMNFIFLAIFTVAESFLLGVTSSVYDVSAVMMAVGITAGVCLALTIFAFQTRWDFTTMGGVLLCATVVLLLFGIIAIFIPRNNIVTLVYASLGALIFSMYLVYDTQLMMGGKHKYSISPEEYIFAALNLYLDIINIFLYILTIIGVYSILMCQLLVTMGFIALFLFHGPTKAWAARNPWMFWVAFAVVFVCLIAMACCDGVRRQAPMNFIFLAIFTVAESFLLGVTSSVYDVSAVMMAVGITAGVCLALTIFAFQTRWDFTTMGGVLLCATVVLLLFGIIAIFIPRNNIVTLVYASLGALIFSMYLVYDTQLMMGGKHKYSISPEEYIFAALNLYLDIINIFLYILTIIGVARD
ncbi:hypothetical protein O3G_MSEX012120 [Manduca sexta]|uniref:Protein lifeguard 1 n=2 Tax=Manduca sexta TaxID=7130 RepID=A0A922CV41_MANSE|nr:hypothetical protein O3G_MSEX012120 [Manduca sexta]